MCHRIRFVISINDLAHELSCWEKCFFFYDNGIVDAIRVILSTFEYPTQREHGYNVHGVNPILHDFEVCLELMERDNAVFENEVDFGILELAVAAVDEAIYVELKKYLGDIEAKTIDATFINPLNDCLLVVEY